MRSSISGLLVLSVSVFDISVSVSFFLIIFYHISLKIASGLTFGFPNDKIKKKRKAAKK